MRQQFPLVQLIELDQNTGFSGGNNLAIEVASEESELVVLINPDAFIEPLWLETLLLLAEFNLEFDMFCSQLLNTAKPALLDGAGDVEWLW